MKKYIIAALLAANGAAQAQVELSNYKPGVTEEGAVYCLPKTTLRFVVQVEKTTYTPGEFAKYAELYMRLGDVGREKTTTYKMTSLDMTTIGTPDKDKYYAVKFNAKSSASTMTLSEDGILLAMNSQPKEPNIPKAFTPAPKPKRTSARNYLNNDIASAGSTVKMAEMVAREIFDIRDTKNQLIRGEADFMPKDGEQLKLMLAQLDQQETALTELFTGTIDRDTTETVIEYCPTAETARALLFRLSAYNGIVDNDDLSGVPYYISITDLHSVPAIDATAKKAKKSESGVYVNVPGRMRAIVTCEGKEVARFQVAAAQFGYAELLDSNLFNKKFNTYLILDPATGGIIKLDGDLPK